MSPTAADKSSTARAARQAEQQAAAAPRPHLHSAHGHVTFLGAGPGDPGLLTLRAVEALAQADVLLADARDERVPHAVGGPLHLVVDLGAAGPAGVHERQLDAGGARGPQGERGAAVDDVRPQHRGVAGDGQRDRHGAPSWSCSGSADARDRT